MAAKIKLREISADLDPLEAFLRRCVLCRLIWQHWLTAKHTLDDIRAAQPGRVRGKPIERMGMRGEIRPTFSIEAKPRYPRVVRSRVPALGRRSCPLPRWHRPTMWRAGASLRGSLGKPASRLSAWCG